MPDADTCLMLDRQGPVLRLVMQRVAKKNALNIAMYKDLTAALQTADADRDVRVVLLTAAGGTFTSGNDLDDFFALRATAPPRPGTASSARASGRCPRQRQATFGR